MTALRWTGVAADQLAAIHAYVGRSSPVHANRLIERCLVRLAAATRAPEAGRIVPEFANPLLREVFEGPYRLIYRLERDALVVVAVIHGRRDGIADMGNTR